MADLLIIRNLKKNYVNKTEELHILKGIDFNLQHEKKVSITGESGSGKSTFLNLIGGLDSVSQGQILIEDHNIVGLDEDEMTFFRNKKIGFVFQSHYLLEEFNALENVMLPYLMNHYQKKMGREKAKYLLNFVGLYHRLNHHPSQLSGGEKQRVAIARAMVNNPALILADEPTGNLDDSNAQKVLELLFDITEAAKHALLMVTHSLQIAGLADEHFHLSGGLLTKKDNPDPKLLEEHY